MNGPVGSYSIGTTNKDQYNYDTVNRRYYGMKVAIEGKMVDNQRLITNYNKIMGALDLECQEWYEWCYQ